MTPYLIYSPSYKRSTKALSHKVFNPKTFLYAVHEFEADEYRKNLPEVQLAVIPDKVKGNIARVRNWILDNKKAKNIIMVDDDMTVIQRVLPGVKRPRVKLNPDQIDAFIQNGFLLAKDCGAKLWGINCQSDPRFYKQNTPLSFSHIILGPFSCILDSPLRYDEKLPLKEDYDFFIQNLLKYRSAVRLNYFNYIVDHQKMAGGCQDYRTSEAEKKNFEDLQKKWGDQIVRANWKNEGSINPIIVRPL